MDRALSLTLLFLAFDQFASFTSGIYSVLIYLSSDKTFSGVSIDTKHNTPTEVLSSFSCVTGIFLGIYPWLWPMFTSFITTDIVLTGMFYDQLRLQLCN